MNYTVRIVNGKPVVFGIAGKKDNGAPVYVFEEEEAFEAALAEGMIPVGSIVIKTYDAVEMAGGPFDAELSNESENAPQNKAVKEAVDRLDQSIADALALRASLTGFGFAKICPVETTDVTEAGGVVLGGFEKNAAIMGSLANKIQKNERDSAKLNGDNTFTGVNVFSDNCPQFSNQSRLETIRLQSYGEENPTIGFNCDNRMDGYLFMNASGNLIFKVSGIEHKLV